MLVLGLHSRGFYVQAYANDLAVLVTGVDQAKLPHLAVGNSVSNMTDPRFEYQTFCPRDKRVTVLPTASSKYCLENTAINLMLKIS